MALGPIPDADDGDDLAEVHDINVTPFIDVMLVLLIIFMVVAPLATIDVPVNLPSASAQPMDRSSQPLFLTLRADRTLLLGDRPIKTEDLQSGLDGLTGGDHDKRVFLRGDKTVPYEAVMQTLDELRHAGYLKIALVGLEGTARQ